MPTPAKIAEHPIAVSRFKRAAIALTSGSLEIVTKRTLDFPHKEYYDKNPSPDGAKTSITLEASGDFLVKGVPSKRKLLSLPLSIEEIELASARIRRLSEFSANREIPMRGDILSTEILAGITVGFGTDSESNQIFYVEISDGEGIARLTSSTYDSLKELKLALDAARVTD